MVPPTRHTPIPVNLRGNHGQYLGAAAWRIAVGDGLGDVASPIVFAAIVLVSWLARQPQLIAKAEAVRREQPVSEQAWIPQPQWTVNSGGRCQLVTMTTLPAS
jgi:hypothetical protein